MIRRVHNIVRKPPAQRLPSKPSPKLLAVRLRYRRAGIALLVVFSLTAIAAIDRVAGVLPVGDDWARYHGQSFKVVRVIDGDTLELAVADGDERTTRVRLWGVDTPELAKPEWGTSDEAWAKEAAKYTRTLADGQWVTLYLQDHRHRGRYGRLLAYVALPDGSVLNERLLARGYAKLEDRWSHDDLAKYDALEGLARRDGLRMWSK